MLLNTNTNKNIAETEELCPEMHPLMYFICYLRREHSVGARTEM